LKLLEGKKVASCVGNYQDAATASLNSDFNNDAATQDDIKADQARPAQALYSPPPIPAGFLRNPRNESQNLECSNFNKFHCVIPDSFLIHSHSIPNTPYQYQE